MELKDISDEEYFGALKMMFMTDGWKIFLQECMDNATSTNSVEDTTSRDDLWYRKGQLAVLGNILNTERSIEIAEEEALKDEEEPFDEND